MQLSWERRIVYRVQHGGGSEKSYYRTDVRAHRSRCRRPVDVTFLFPEVSTLKSGRLFFSFFSPPHLGSCQWHIWRRERNTAEGFSRCRHPSLQNFFLCVIRLKFSRTVIARDYFIWFSPQNNLLSRHARCLCVPGTTEEISITRLYFAIRSIG